MSKREINILEVIHELIHIMGSPILDRIFEEYGNDEERLYKALKDYMRGIYYAAHDHEDEDDEDAKKVIHHYAYINGVVIDAANISRIELDSDYNPKKNRNNYFIRIVKKYPTPLEEEYIIPFDSEEERDKGYDILVAKLKLCCIYIV